MTESEANSQPLDSQCEKKFKLIDFLTQRLEHTIGHTQTATKLIYLLNGAILAAVYFELGKVQPISAAFKVAAFLTFLLSIINFLHANFLATQNAWYRVIDQEIRRVFLTFKDFESVWPQHLGDVLDSVWKSYGGVYSIFPFKRSHRIYVWIHLVAAFFLLFSSLASVYMSYNVPCIEIMEMKPK
jgi:hypothetical protein